MTIKQANWIQIFPGREDVKIWQVVQKLKDENRLDEVSQEMFQGIWDAWDDRTIENEDKVVRQILNNLMGVWKNA